MPEQKKTFDDKSLEATFGDILGNMPTAITKGAEDEDGRLAKEWQKLKNSNFQNDISLRSLYAKVFLWVCVVLCFVQVALVGLIGRKILIFDLPVTLELIPLTFVDVISIMYIICHYLFPNKNGDHHHSESDR